MLTRRSFRSSPMLGAGCCLAALLLGCAAPDSSPREPGTEHVQSVEERGNRRDPADYEARPIEDLVGDIVIEASEAGSKGLPRDAFGTGKNVQAALAQAAKAGSLTVTPDRIIFRPAPPGSQQNR